MERKMYENCSERWQDILFGNFGLVFGFSETYVIEHQNVD